MVLTRTPSPWMIRRTGRIVRSRAGPYAGGESPATALAAPSDPIYPLRSSRREQVADPRHQARPVSRRTVCEVTTVWLGRSEWSRRDTRQRIKRLGSGPIGGGGDSPLTRRAPGYRHDCAQSRGSNPPPPSSSVRARTSRFSAATNRSEVPATPLSLRLGAPVSQRYRDVEDASASRSERRRDSTVRDPRRSMATPARRSSPPAAGPSA